MTLKIFLFILSTLCLPLNADQVFKKHIAPILSNHCLSCHGDKKQKGQLRLDTREHFLKGGKNGSLIEAHQPFKSLFYLKLIHDDPDEIMPQKADPLSQQEIAQVKTWIEAGGTWPESFAFNQNKRQEAMERLKPFQAFISLWKGSVRPGPRSDMTSWSEQSDWRWHYTADQVSVKFTAPKSQMFVEGRFSPGKQAHTYQLQAKHHNRKIYLYEGTWDEKQRLKLKRVSTSQNKKEESIPSEILIQQVSLGERLLIYYHVPSFGKRMRLQAMAGYTRDGVKFGSGGQGNLCIITGGQGTRAVQFEGKTYYVCCGGCLDEFNDNPSAAVKAHLKQKTAK